MQKLQRTHFQRSNSDYAMLKKRKHIKNEKKNAKSSSVSNTRRRATSVRDINASWVSFWQPSQIGLELNFHGNHFVPPRLLKSGWVSCMLTETASCPCMLWTVNLQHSLWLHYNRARGFSLPGEQLDFDFNNKTCMTRSESLSKDSNTTPTIWILVIVSNTNRSSSPLILSLLLMGIWSDFDLICVQWNNTFSIWTMSIFL